LERAGHRIDILPVAGSWWRGPELRRADVVLLQRKLLAPWQLFLVRQAARLLLFDFDDAVFQRDSYAAKGLHCGRRRSRFAGISRRADGLLAGNAFLAAAAVAAGAPPGNVRVIPTCVDPSRYPTARHERRSPGLQLVWVGSSSTLQGLEAVRPLLETVGAGCPGVELKLVCDRFLRLQHLAVVEHRWSEETEAAEIAAADVGVSWLPNDDWSRGKCGLKVLQYMAAGLPVVANPVGVQATMIEHGITGFLATTADDWVTAVRRLAADPELRRRMGAAGRERVDQRYSVAAGARLWRDLLGRLRPRRVAS
jgi:glycosyltransferase involved in cell wall biosynthesis